MKHIGNPQRSWRFLFVMAFSVLFGLETSMAKPQYIPVVSGLFTTGQWYFQGDESSLGGNAQLTFVPALKFSNRFSLIPQLETNYRGTRSAEELAGGNTLFQDTWENALSLKGVHSLGRGWKFRERVGGRYKYFRETTDETLGKGLYDYQLYTFGGEVEHRWSKKLLLAVGYDYSILKFPNYESLESDQSNDLAREFAGDDTLDANIHLATLRTHMPFFFGAQTKIQGFYSPREYPDQHIVELTGALIQDLRKDLYSGGTLALEKMFKTPKRTFLFASVFYGYTGLDSSQNHYDARQTEFVADYFDYDQQKVGTQFSFGFGRGRYGPNIIETGATYQKRKYSARVTQTTSGGYTNEKLYQVEQALTLAFSYPLSKFFRLRTSAFFGRSRSNNDYEELYRYNYNHANYQFGFTYEY